jgi:YVTN family beta-propeller protein
MPAVADESRDDGIVENDAEATRFGDAQCFTLAIGTDSPRPFGVDDHDGNGRGRIATTALGTVGPSCRVDPGGEGRAYRLLGEVPVGLDPEGVVVRRATGLVYVACSRSNAVAVVDPNELRLTDTIAVGAEPIDIAVDDHTGHVFTADARSDQLSVIDADAGAVIATVPVGCYPAGLCIDANARRLYSGDAAGSTMSVVDLDTLERVGVVQAELGAGAVEADGERGRVYCVNFVASSVTVIDARTLEVIGRIPLLAGPCAVGVHRPSGEVFVVDSLASTVTKIDGTRVEKIAEMPVPNAPVGLAMGLQGDRLYVGNRGDGSLSVLGLDGVEWSRIPVGAAPGGVCADPLHPGRVLVANAGSGTLSVVDDLLTGAPDAPVDARAHPMVGLRMPRLALPDLWTRELRDLGEWAGRKYVLNVFASW